MSSIVNKVIITVDENSIKDKIYLISGQRVMLDFDLAEIYGYETRKLNEQVKTNIERFGPDFMFQLKKSEWESILRSKNRTAKTLSS
ncbi:MAG: ORF6N domain-containing protein [Bacilli bacterium]|nr:ORF6N domain-containing protein [Bacilli bacterium]